MSDSSQPSNTPVYPQVFKSDPKKSINLPNTLSKVRIMFGVIGFLVMAVGVGLAVNLAQQQQTASSRASEVRLTASPSATFDPNTRNELVQTILSVFGQSGGVPSEDQNNDGKINELDFGSVYSQ